MDGLSLWYERRVLGPAPGGPAGGVQAVACLVKVLYGTCSMDILFVSGCEAINGDRPGVLECVPAGDALRVLPADAEGRAVDCIRLTGLIGGSPVVGDSGSQATRPLG